MKGKGSKGERRKRGQGERGEGRGSGGVEGRGTVLKGVKEVKG